MDEYNEEDMRKAYVEVLEVLNYVPRDEYFQIPKSVIDEMRNNKNRFYEFKYTGVDKLSRLACVIMIDIYTKYIADKRKRKIVKDILELNEKKHQKESGVVNDLGKFH